MQNLAAIRIKEPVHVMISRKILNSDQMYSMFGNWIGVGGRKGGGGQRGIGTTVIE